MKLMWWQSFIAHVPFIQQALGNVSTLFVCNLYRGAVVLASTHPAAGGSSAVQCSTVQYSAV